MLTDIKKMVFYYVCKQADDELDPEDVEFDEHYTDTRSKCMKKCL